MKLGFLTAPFPETPLMEVADWAASVGFEVLEIACWPRSSRQRAQVRRAPPTSTSPTCRAARAAEIRDEIAAKGLDISRPRLLPQPAAPRPGRCARPPSTTSRRSSWPRSRMGLPRDEHVLRRRRQQARRRQLGGGPAGLARHRALRAGPGRQDHLRELPHDLQLRRVAGRAQHRLLALHLASHPRGLGRHGGPQLRPQPPRLADDRPAPLRPRVRAAHPPLPGQGRAHRPATASTSAARSRAASAGRCPRIPGLGDAPWAGIFSELYRGGYDGPIIIEHEDRVFEGTDEKVKRGFLVARDQLRPFVR